MPIDIKLLRVEKSDDPEKVKASQDNIERVKKSQRDRFADETLVDQVIDLDDQWRKANYQMESLQMEFNALNKEIGDKKKASKGQDKCEDLLAKSGEIKKTREEKKLLAVELDKQRTQKLGLIGNVLSD
jgi:seryl-tRNA synthetase